MGFRSEVEGKPAAEVLSGTIPDLVRSLTFHKTMFWAQSNQRFARPIRWVVALHRVHHRRAGVVRYPIRFGNRRTSRDWRPVRPCDRFPRTIWKSSRQTASSFHKRNDRRRWRAELEAAAKNLNGQIIADDALLQEVVYINEYPTVIAGTFEERFLELPREVLITVMREHQKYFALESSEGVLLANFLAVINTRGDQKGMIRKGHERVLRARLSDALFFWDVDGKQTLEEPSRVA